MSETIRIRVATRNPNIEGSMFRVVVHLAPFILGLDERLEDVEVTSAGPRLFHFSFPPGVHEALLRYSTRGVEVHEDVLRYTRLHSDTRGYIQINEAVLSYTRMCSGTQGCTLVLGVVLMYTRL
jgi:hypothetical protein